MKSRLLVFGILVVGIFATVPAKADWIINNDGTVTRSQILGNDSEKKEEKVVSREQKVEKKEEKKEEKREKREEKREINTEGKVKMELQEGSVKLKIDRENGVLKIKSKNEKGEEFELETKKEEKVKIKSKSKDDDDIEVASGSGENLRIIKNKIEAETELPVVVDTRTRKLSVEGKEIIMPDVAVKNTLATGSAAVTTRVELKIRGQETVYEINQEEKKKLFGIFNFVFNKSSVVSANTGTVLENNQAWWSSLLESFAR